MNSVEFQRLLDSESPLILKRDWKQLWTLVLPGIITFLLLSVSIIKIRADHSWSAGIWLCLIDLSFFGLVFLFFQIIIVFIRYDVVLDEDCFYLGKEKDKKYKYKWQDVSEFKIVYTHSLGHIVEVTTDDEMKKEGIKPSDYMVSYKTSTMHEHSCKLLIPDQYGLTANQLAQLMNHWRIKAFERSVEKK